MFKNYLLIANLKQMKRNILIIIAFLVFVLNALTLSAKFNSNDSDSKNTVCYENYEYDGLWTITRCFDCNEVENISTYASSKLCYD